MNNEKKPEAKIVLKGGFAEWFDNFWYHYKWPVIGIAVALVILLVCLSQCSSKEKEDIQLAYAGPTVLSAREMQLLTEVMNTVMPYDFDENGSKHTTLSTYNIYSAEQIKELEKIEEGYVDRSRNSNEYSTYGSYLQTGQSSVYFLDPWLYAEFSTDHLVPLSDVLGEVPEGAIDAYGVRLGDTDLYREYAVLQLLPEDTVICLMRQLVIGRSSDDECYRFEQDMFRAIVTYETAEEQ